MSAKGDEIYFTVQTPLEEITYIGTARKKNGRWQQPEIASFSGKYRDLEPFLDPHGLKLYFVSTRPLDDATEKPKDHDIWFVERESPNHKWSRPKNLGAPVNSDKEEFYPSVAANGNIYFTLESTGKKPDIATAVWNGTAYEKPGILGDAINSDGDEYNAYIAPDESFLIFGAYNRPDGIGSGDLYISVKGLDGNWVRAENLGKTVNSVSMDYCPYIDWTTRTLYFTSRRSQISKDKTSTIGGFLNEANGYENGLSRLYRVSAETILAKLKK